ncbi:MAG: glutamine synthetase family protein [Bacillota bacterium]|nr:glutamine synthetase family protein [Bacillota bacterium]
MEFADMEDVKFIRLAFCDLFGNQKNISIMPEELERAFDYGISFDASAIKGFEAEVKSDLFLHPDPSTLTILPWRPSNGRVVRMFCDIKYPNGTPFEKDTRYILKKAVSAATEKGIACNIGAEAEFYLFKLDEDGNPTNEPFDNAEYMDIAPEDKAENIRREICLSLESMGIIPETSHHEEGPGQNEIDFRYSDPLVSADNDITFKSVVKTIAMRNGAWASFSPKPLSDCSGNGMHINISFGKDGYNENILAGIMAHIKEITAFLNPTVESYKRLGEKKAPKYISWSYENRSQLIRIPAPGSNDYKRLELRSPDPMTNPYLAYTLLIYSALDGIENNLKAPEACNINLYNADISDTSTYDKLPDSLSEALKISASSEFINKIGFSEICEIYKKYLD